MNAKETKTRWQKTILIFCLIFIPATLITGAAIYYVYELEVNAREAKIFQREKLSLENLEHEIHHEFENIIADLLFINQHHELDLFFANQAGALHDLEHDWKHLCQQRGIYDQVRFLDMSGMEAIRINYLNGAAQVAPRSELQNKSGRYYFEQAIKLKKGDVYISPFDLNVEKGQIEKPLKPMIRFATPNFDKHGKLRGIVILNYLGKNLLSHLKALENSVPKPHPMLINAEGFWLYAGNPKLEWGFMQRHNLSFKDSRPELWRKIKDQGAGNFITDQGIYSFATIHPMFAQYSDATHSELHHNHPQQRLIQDGYKNYYWKVLSLVSHAQIAEVTSPLANDLFRLFLLLMFLEGAAAGWLALLTTDRQAVFSLLKENEKRLSMATRIAGLGIWEVNFKPPGSFWSPEMHRILGTDPERTAIRENSATTDEDAVHQLLDNINGASFNPTEMGEGDQTREFQIVRPDGSKADVRGSAVSINGKHGKPEKLIGVMLDVTQQKQTLNQLEEASEKYLKLSKQFQGLLLAIEDTIFVVNQDREHTWSNKNTSTISGHGRDECQVYNLAGHHCPDCPIEACFSSGLPNNSEISTAAGEFWNLRTFPVRSDQQEIENVIVMLHNITEQTQQQARSIRANQLTSLGEMAAGVAHEINNPINGVINYNKMLLNKFGDQAMARDLAERTIAEGERIARIVKNLLFFSQGGREERRGVKIGNLFADITPLLIGRLEKSGIDLQFEQSEELPDILARPQQIQQVLLNIMTNAMYALDMKDSPPEPGKLVEVKIESVAVATKMIVRTTITDYGTGIARENLDRIMTPFFTTKPAGVGTGLGLSTCHEIIQAHDGHLEVESVEGEYTRVFVDLPAAS